jgi:hypothetical protein
MRARCGSQRWRCNETTDLKPGEVSAMNGLTFGARRRPIIGSDEPKPENVLNTAWIVLEAANDLGDHATVETCRRVIDANLNGSTASPHDVHIVTEYFR